VKIQGIDDRAVQPDGSDTALTKVSAQDTGVKSVPCFFMQHFQKVQCTLIPAGQGLS
jgi:hypothetical protein